MFRKIILWSFERIFLPHPNMPIIIFLWIHFRGRRENRNRFITCIWCGVVWSRFYFCEFCDEQMKWNESGFRPPLCTYRLNWARRTSWGWWDDWDDTVLQTQVSKFEPWRSEAEHATSRSRRLPTILTFTRGWGRNNFVSFKPPRPGTEPRTLAWKAAVLTTTLGPPPLWRADICEFKCVTYVWWFIHEGLLNHPYYICCNYSVWMY